MDLQLPTELRHWSELERLILSSPPELRREAHRRFAPESLYYLIRMVLTTKDIRDEVTGERQVEHPFLFEYAQAVQEESDDIVDIGARGHWKSTLKTFASPLRMSLRNPNVGIGIFSFQRKLAKAHLSRIKQEIEGNKELRATWPEIFWENPNSSIHGAPMWSLESGLILKRRSARTDATFEAHSFDRSLPTGKHFDILIFDDVVDEDNCRTADARAKGIEQWQLALNLSSRGAKFWYVGTHYHAADLWVYLEDEKGYTVRRRPAVDVSKPAPEGSFQVTPQRSVSFEAIGGEPVFLTPEELTKKAWDFGPKVYGQQMLCDPRAGEDGTFDATKIRYYRAAPGLEARAKMRYLLVDPANKKNSDSDRSGYMVVGLGADQNFYILDLWKGKLDPLERVRKAIELHRKWAPLHDVRWEQNGLETDVFWLQQEQERQGYRFKANGYAWRIDKKQRLTDNLGPAIEQERIWVPQEILQDRDGERVDNVRELVHEEIAKHPLSKEDHWLDCLNLLFHPKAPALAWPTQGPRRITSDSFADSAAVANGSWMSA